MTGRDGSNSVVYTFDGFRFDVSERLVYSPDGEPYPLKAKDFEILLYLVEHPGRLIERDEIMAAVWPDTVVEENNLTQHISSLRRIFGVTPNDHRFIETVSGRGYKFAAVVVSDTNGNDKSDQINEMLSRTPRRWLATLSVSVVIVLLLLGFLYKRDATPPAGTIRSIAVLPFKPVSEQDRNLSFEMGMTNELITKLADADGLSVRSYQAVKRYVSEEQDPIDAGRELGVDAVLECSVQLSADRVRVLVRLMNVADSKIIWMEPFDKERTHLFDVQDAIAERVANSLKVQLSESAKKRYTDNGPAYELYLDGQFHLLRLAPEDEIKLGIAKFQQAVDLDPNFALAYTGIARGYMSLVLSAEAPPGEMIEQSLASAERAVQIDPRLAEAQATLGAVYFWFKHDWAASEAAFKTALDLDPHSTFAHVYYAALLGNLGRTDEALAECKKAQDLDPFWAYAVSMQGTILVHAGRPEEALTRYGEAIRLNPRLWTAQSKAALALIDLHRYDEAIATARKAAELNSAQTNSLALESYALAKLGRRGEARKILDDLLRRSRQGYVPEYHIAVVYAGLGEPENALAWLEKGFIQKDPRMLWLRSEYFWNPFRSEPRFVDLMRKMKLE
jgi:serine/threonine-protein kinase